MRPSDSRETGLPLPRVSQVPRLLFPSALSPITPRSPLLASECLFSNGFRLQPFRQLGHSRFQRNEAESSSLLLWLTSSPSQASPWGLLLSVPGRLHGGHSVVMLVSFQTNREVRLSLTHLKTLMNQNKRVIQSFLVQNGFRGSRNTSIQ